MRVASVRCRLRSCALAKAFGPGSNVAQLKAGAGEAECRAIGDLDARVERRLRRRRARRAASGAQRIRGERVAAGGVAAHRSAARYRLGAVARSLRLSAFTSGRGGASFARARFGARHTARRLWARTFTGNHAGRAGRRRRRERAERGRKSGAWRDRRSPVRNLGRRRARRARAAHAFAAGARRARATGELVGGRSVLHHLGGGARGTQGLPSRRVARRRLE